jgi:hypothetical protein
MAPDQNVKDSREPLMNLPPQLFPAAAQRQTGISR